MNARLACASARKALSGRAASLRKAVRAIVARPALNAARAPAASRVPANNAHGEPRKASAHHSILQ